MADPDPVCFAVPLRLAGDNHLAEVPEGGPEDIDARVFATVNTPLGHRDDLPEFGRPGQVYRRGGADLGQLERLIGLWVPDADIHAMRQEGRLQELADGLDRVTLEEVSGGSV